GRRSAPGAIGAHRTRGARAITHRRRTLTERGRAPLYGSPHRRGSRHTFDSFHTVCAMHDASPPPIVAAPPIPPGPPPVPPAPRRNPWPAVAAVLIGAAGATFTVSAQVAAWLVEQFLLVAGLPQPAWLPPAASALTAAIFGGAATLLATLPQSATIRTIGRAWALSAVALVALSLPRAI